MKLKSWHWEREKKNLMYIFSYHKSFYIISCHFSDLVIITINIVIYKLYIKPLLHFQFYFQSCFSLFPTVEFAASCSFITGCCPARSHFPWVIHLFRCVSGSFNASPDFINECVKFSCLCQWAWIYVCLHWTTFAILKTICNIWRDHFKAVCHFLLILPPWIIWWCQPLRPVLATWGHP